MIMIEGFKNDINNYLRKYPNMTVLEYLDLVKKNKK